MEGYAWVVPKDPMSFLTHFAAFLAAAFGSHSLFRCAASERRAIALVFSASMLTVYGCSSISHHGFGVGEYWQYVLDRCDHFGIFVMITGTLTTTLSVVKETTRRTLVLIWTLAIVLMLLQLTLPANARGYMAALFIGLGGLVLIWLRPLRQTLPVWGMVLLLCGGATYILGACVWMWEWPCPSPWFDSHPTMHVVIGGGSLQHYFFVRWYVVGQ